MCVRYTCIRSSDVSLVIYYTEQFCEMCPCCAALGDLMQVATLELVHVLLNMFYNI